VGGRESTYRRVVVAYDGSESSEDALALALRLRDPAEGVVVLACVVPGGVRHFRQRRTTEDRACRAAGEMLAEARARIPAGVGVELRAPVAPSPARGLTELAEWEDADLLTVGSAHGAAGNRIGLTRTAGRLLHGAPCAVAVAPPGLRDAGPFRHVGVALDGSAEAAAALDRAYAIAGAHASAMTLYGAVDEFTPPGAGDPEPLRRAVQERLDAAADAAPPGVNPATVMLRGAAGIAIAGACEGVVDLLVCGSRAYGPVQRALLGSVSEELIARATHPVLVVPRVAERASAVADAA
jgi:nucleotide-binding universal stress UspA family protein